jgi:hypothetical protein
VSSENLLIDLTAELNDFLRVATLPFAPPFDLRDVLENVFSAITVNEFAEENLVEYAICFAYDALNGDGEARIEEGDIPRGPHRDRFEAVMRLGTSIYQRFSQEYHAYLPPDGFFPYVFAEVYSDHLVRLTKADYEELGLFAALSNAISSRHRL